MADSDPDKSRESDDETRADAIYRALTKAMLSRDLAPGTKLGESDIGDAFAVSRTAVRAALNRLHSEGLVEFRKKRGAYVASPSPAEARQILQLRKLLERTVASRLADSLTPAQSDELETMVAAHAGQHRSGLDAEAMHAAEQFHLALARMLGHGVLQTTLSRLIVRSALVLALYSRHNVSECGIDEHREIIDALRSGDSALAAKLMDEHLDGVAERAMTPHQDREAPTLGEILGPHLGVRART